ncbi:MAG: hypothetical protein COV67_14785 [Nitrospinae bacterium CG11_big_fil_rev_8_21_14_0_20_56_8]|nr:MAG: hypothetical protein COV67_14785 [Nitrospinae bacterium CG11_big_fil_rev_8_21_14_0_20_56_8]
MITAEKSRPWPQRRFLLMNLPFYPSIPVERFFLNILFLLVLGGLAGCATRHTVIIDPYVPVTSSQTGGGKKVGLKVVDSRKSNIIAKWSDKINLRKFDVVPDSDIIDTLDFKISEGLGRLGYYPKRNSGSLERLLTIELLLIHARYEEKLPNMKVQIKTAFHAECKNQGQSYGKIYTDRKNLESTPASTFPNEKLINASLSNILLQMFSDPNLLDCLNH